MKLYLQERKYTGDYRRSLRQVKDPIPTMDDMVEFDVWNYTKESEKNIKL